MITNFDVTIYHYDEKNDKFNVSFKGRASAYVLAKIKPDERGRIFDSSAKIRIPVFDFRGPKVSVGDYIFIGKTESETPQKADCYHIVGVLKNYNGVSPHIKIIAV